MCNGNTEETNLRNQAHTVSHFATCNLHVRIFIKYNYLRAKTKKRHSLETKLHKICAQK